jgi:hypothetical protein
MKNLILTLLLGAPYIASGQVPLTTPQIADRASPSVVVIDGKTDTGDVLGSGFIISKDGKIVTNLHVIRDMNTAGVQTATGEIFDSISVLATDEHLDLAIVKVAGLNLPVAELGNSDTLTIGEPVVIVGSPRGLEGTVTAGILSSVRDLGEGYKVLQTDAAVNPGNSGGPLLNSKGQTIGVISFQLRSAQGLNFAVPINYVRGLLNNLHEPITLEELRKHLFRTAPATQQGGGPSLKETLDWLKEKLPIGVVQFSWLENGRTWNYVSRLKAWDLESCTITVGTEMTTGTNQYNPPPGTTRYTIPLGSLIKGMIQKHNVLSAPNTQVVSGDSVEFRLSFFSSGNQIVMQVNSVSGSKAVSQDYFNLPFNDESVARRVMDAFNHAAELCRKREPF